MEIPGLRKPASGRMPVKRTINFATVGEKPFQWAVVTAVAAVAVLLCAAAVKFAVLDRFRQVAEARSEVETLQRQADAAYETLQQYLGLEEDYAHFTYAGMTEEELALADRVGAMELIDAIILPTTQVDSWALTGNSLVVNVSGSTLQTVNQMTRLLEEKPLVSYCTVTAASTGKAGAGDAVTARLVIYLQDAGSAEGEEAAP